MLKAQLPMCALPSPSTGLFPTQQAGNFASMFLGGQQAVVLVLC